MLTPARGSSVATTGAVDHTVSTAMNFISSSNMPPPSLVHCGQIILINIFKTDILATNAKPLWQEGNVVHAKYLTDMYCSGLHFI